MGNYKQVRYNILLKIIEDNLVSKSLTVVDKDDIHKCVDILNVFMSDEYMSIYDEFFLRDKKLEWVELPMIPVVGHLVLIQYFNGRYGLAMLGETSCWFDENSNLIDHSASIKSWARLIF